MLKDASYYIERFDDIPSDLLKKIQSLSREAYSNRFVCMSVQELCELFELEYSEKSFIEDCQKCYAHIEAYLERHNLKLVPCSIPADLSFYDKIFVTPKPDLNNDEDCSIVRTLIASKRAPTAKDAIHISRMNCKLINYNIMLRVFEALFVISSTKLDFHQSSTVNSIISSLELPKEGLSYLRTCYTYAAEYRNRHTNFERKEYCFKPLNTEQTQRICAYLAQIAAASSYIEQFNRDYPYYDELEAQFKKLAGSIRKQQNDLVCTVSSAPKELCGFTLEKQFFNCIKLGNRLLEQKKNEKVNYLDIFCTNHPARNCVFFKELFAKLQELDNPPLEPLLPDNLFFTYFDDISGHRPFNGLFFTSKTDTWELYPNVLFRKITDLAPSCHKVLKDSLNEMFLAFLQNRITFAKNSGTEDTRTVTTSLTNLSILGFNLFFKLITLQLFEKFDKKDLNDTYQKLNDEYKNSQSEAILLLRGLSFIFNDVPEQLEYGRISVDDLTLLSLKVFPELASLTCKIIAKSKPEATFNELYCICPQAFNFYILFLVQEGCEAVDFIGKPNNTNIHTARFLNNIAGTFIKQLDPMLIDKYITVSMNSDKRVQLSYDEVIRDAGDRIKRVSSSYQNPYLLQHALFKRLIYPLFCEKLCKNASGFSISLSTDCINSISKLLNDNYSIFKYLLGCSNDSDSVFAELLTDRLSKLDAQLLKRKLKDHTFDKVSSLSDLFKIKYVSSLLPVFEVCLRKLGLMEVPVESALPRFALSAFSHRRIISTALENKQLDKTFINKLCAAQMALLLFCFTMPLNTAEIRLARMMELTPEQNVFAINFLSTVKSLILQKKAFEDYRYRALYAEQKSNENFRLCFKYLKQLAYEEIETSPLKSYVAQQFNELFKKFQSKKTLAFSEQKERTDKAIDLTQENRQPAISTQRNQTSPAKQSFFKPVSFDLRKLNSDLIKSKIKESSMIQDVINQIRTEEGGLGSNEVTGFTATESVDSAKSDTEKSNAPTNTQEKYTYPSESCRKLIEDIKRQNSEVIDLDEFNGLCMSLKFMSKDAAIEEINDWAYENFDEPILDVAYDENCIYITLSILDEL